jgi:membrane associated rhomboid family serine protease
VGIYDRDYYRSERPGLHLNAPRTAVAYLILINVVLWLANGLLTPSTNGITYTLAAKDWSLARPWLWWQFLTYGFVHAPQLWHLFFNMLGLFFFGREVEIVYGRKEFLRFYLVVLVLGSVVWAIVSWLAGTAGVLLGASGAIVAIVILFAVNFPRQTVLFMFFLPMPAWVLGVLLVASDLYGAVARPDSGVAYMVHLTGAAVALLYYRFGWNFGNLVPGRWPWHRFRMRPKLRIHAPPLEQDQLREEVDRILEKISRGGEESLSRKERRTLEDASRQYQKRRGIRD